MAGEKQLVALSQTVLNQMAAHILAAYGTLVESVTYRNRTSVSATPVTYTITKGAVFLSYEHRAVAMYAMIADDRPMILGTDRPIIIPMSLITWTPTTADEVVRTGGETWRIIAIAGGSGMPFYEFQGRKKSN